MAIETSLYGSGSTTLSIGAATGTPGNYSFTVTATSGSLTRTATALLSVQDFTWTVSPTSQSVTSGSTGTYTITATGLNGFNSTILSFLSACDGWNSIEVTTFPGAIAGTGSTFFVLGPIFTVPVLNTPATRASQ
ncbi:MAG: hypothetical protein ACLQVN_21940 [Bryobacteraceae bacterium]